ncbi:serine/threonine-protein kinase [Nocardia shimofusensis]|uniref:serine/threonine-protein kinase n=1 Tax=Nocardia shimofusensis TaxID=228596 RepID=UPI00082B20D6|nr:serine/threonine-protein kinase [Nocardia shimofusensis]
MLQPGAVFAGYTVEKLLGRGGMGAVYLARHPRLPRRTALKLLNREAFADPELRARFEREGNLVAQLDHPNIVSVYDRGVEGEQLWISMQYVDGVDGSSLDPQTLPPQRAAQIVAETATALDYAHRMGVLHRDVKPANIMLSRAAGQERVFLTDFGIARPQEDTTHLTKTGTVTATLAYASPEQLTGGYMDHRTDQYALACTLFWLLTGRVPFAATQPVAVIHGHLRERPPLLSTVRPGMPPALDAVLNRALSKRIDERFDSCVEFATAVRQAMGLSAPHLAQVQRAPMSAPATPQAPAQSFVNQVPAPAVTPRAPAQHVARPPVAPYRPHGQQRPGWVAGPATPRPAYPPPNRAPAARRKGSGAKIATAIIGLVLLLVAGVAVLAWNSDAVRAATGRSRGDEDLAAMRTAFPGMLPAGTESGDGYQGATCFPYSRWYDFLESEGYESVFDPWQAKVHCVGGFDGPMSYTFYSYPSAAEAGRAAAALATRGEDHGSDTVGSRTDRKFVAEDRVGSESAIVVSTFSDRGRERWVLVFDRTGGESELEELVAAVRSAPL